MSLRLWITQMVKNMENKTSLLVCNNIDITSQISIHIPTVGEILNDEQGYYNIVGQIIASPYSRMVELDDIGIDFTTISDFDLFIMYAAIIFSQDLSLIFGNTFKSLKEKILDEKISLEQKEKFLRIIYKTDNNEKCLYDAVDDIIIDNNTYQLIADTIRKINDFSKETRKPGNESAKKYLLEKKRRYQKRHAKDKYKPVLESLVISLVNKQEFKYNYEQVIDLSIYKFNCSLKQIQHSVNFDKLMIGVYAGTVDTTKITDKKALTWISD